MKKYYKEPDKPFLTKEEAMLLKLKRVYLELGLGTIGHNLNCSAFDILAIEECRSTDKELIMKYKFLLEKQMEMCERTIKIVPNHTTKKFWNGDTTK